MHFTKSFDLQKYLNLGGEYMNNSKNLLSNTKSLVLLGVFIALGAILMLIEIPYPPVPFLKFDLSELIVLLTVEVFGLVPAIIVAAAKSIVNIMLGMSATPMHIGSITAFIASTTMACLYVLVKKYLSGTTVVNKSLRFLLVITGFSSILTLCNYLFITPIYFGGLWFTDVIGWATLESFIPGLPFDLGYGAAIAFVYLPFNAIKGLLVLGIYEMIAPRLLVALQKILKNLKLSPVVSE